MQATGDDRWEHRIARARQLAGERASVRSILTFYADLATWQQSVVRRVEGDRSADRARGTETLIAVAAAAVPEILGFLVERGPPLLQKDAAALRDRGPDEWVAALGGRLDSSPAAPAAVTDAFVLDALVQPLLEALRPDVVEGGPTDTSACPWCGAAPSLGVMRESGQSRRRWLVCGDCALEYAWPRSLCPACGERGFHALPVYRAPEFPGVRVDACARCRSYVKSVDLSVEPTAVPPADDLASLALDLWAREQGYIRIRPSLFRI